MDLTEFLNEFQLEAGEKLDVIASQLLRLERDSSNLEPVREMFLAAHTIKGGAAMMRLTEVEALAHATEDLLSSIRDKQRVLDGPTADLLFQAIDRLRALIGNASDDSVGKEPNDQLAAFARSLRTGAPQPPRLRRAAVVDDSRTARELHRMLLEDAGYEVEIYDDADVAVDRAVASGAEIIVAGFQSASHSGLEIPSAVRPHDIKVIVATADPDEDTAHLAADKGVYALVRRGSLRESELSSVLAGLKQPA